MSCSRAKVVSYVSQGYKTSCKIVFSDCFLRVSRKSEAINEILYLQTGTSMYVIQGC